jgi:hypothetical protein
MANQEPLLGGRRLLAARLFEPFPGRPGRPATRRNFVQRGLPGLSIISLLAVFFALAASPAHAQWADLKLICPNGGSSDPYFEGPRGGAKIPISDPRLLAVAEKSCNPRLASNEHAAVTIANNRTTPIYVGFTTIDHKPGPITWGTGCSRYGTGARIAPGVTCKASVVSNAVPSRFCAALNAVPTDCFNAQANHQTMIETNFEPSSNPGCFNKGHCVWFDISVIPSTCTDALWKQNQCANTGGASYNLPVSLGCGGNTIYTCQGPQTKAYGPANYPSKCGNPNSMCQSAPNCQNAYFYPMFVPPENKYQPNTVCLGGQTFVIKFLAGS